MNNFKLDVVSLEKFDFQHALEIALNNSPGKKATHYAVIDYKAKVNEWMNKEAPRKTLLLFWTGDEYFKPTPSAFPAKMGCEALIPFVENWLKEVWKDNPPGQEPDQDGDNYKGWRIFNEEWGHLAESHYAFVGIQPVWAMFGK